MGMGENSPVLPPTFAPNLVTFTAVEAAAAAPASSVEDATVATALRRDKLIDPAASQLQQQKHLPNYSVFQ